MLRISLRIADLARSAPLVDETNRIIRSHEHGGVLTTWNHALHVEPIDKNTCRYSDTVEIDTGHATALVAATGVGMTATGNGVGANSSVRT